MHFPFHWVSKISMCSPSIYVNFVTVPCCILMNKNPRAINASSLPIHNLAPQSSQQILRFILLIYSSNNPHTRQGKQRYTAAPTVRGWLIFNLLTCARLQKAAILKQMEVWSRKEPSLQGLANEIMKALEPYDLEELQKK